MARVLWTPVAESDLEDILFYIALIDRRPAIGERLFYEIRDRIADYSYKPLAGHEHPHAPPGWRYVKHKRWLIFYQRHAEGIEVMRVVDGVRDIPRQLPDK
jgi:plasmid stabilization system protein ParE